MNKLEQLRQWTDVVADTGDLAAITDYRPVDATTNPSLLLKAAGTPACQKHLDTARRYAADQTGSDESILSLCADRFAVEIGAGILDVIPGRVSSEVDARLSFNQSRTVDKARHLIDLYADKGIGPERVLIKIASTWEGIRAAEVLEKEGVNCNLTLLFGFSQAVACADAGVFLISPFVGRILDWYKASTGEDYTAATDPGVGSVKRIYQYYKTHGYNTVVMGASFRNTGEIEALAGCDRLTISPALLEELSVDEGELERVLSPEMSKGEAKVAFPEDKFRWAMNDDAMVTEKLAEGIRQFATDQVKLENILKTH